MDERIRRRKSLWEAEDGNLRNSWSGKERYASYDVGHNLKFSSSKVDNNLLIPKDQAYAGERTYKGGLSEPETREQGLNKNYYKNTSPGIDEWVRRKHSDSRDEDLVHSYRFLDSRSRSRSRDRGRSRSRSQSWDRDHDGIRSRSRSRSRSRNRNRNRARGQSRSRSPFYDRRRESHRWNDKSGSELSSQICRDFASGNCRRGSQCRFLHTDGMDGDSEDDRGERWKSRPDRARTLRYGEETRIQSWDKVPDSSYGDDNSRNKSRGTISCKNFVRGKCQWGASCRFSHHVGSSDNNAAKGVGNASFGHDRDHQGSGSGKPMCKYFLVGKCNRENCWFSHDDSVAGNQERRPHNEGGRHSLSAKSGGWNGPTWDQNQTKSDISKGAGWSEREDANQSTANSVLSERMDNKWGPEGRTSRSPEWKEKASEKSSFISTQERNEDNGRDLGAMKSIVTGNSNDRQEYPPISPGLESAKLDEISTSSHARILTEEDSSQHIPMATVPADASLKSEPLQNDLVLNNNSAKAFNYDGLGEVKDLRNTVNPEFIPRKSPSQNAVGNLDFNQSLVSNDPRDNLFFSRPSNLQNFDLNGSVQVLPSSLSMQNHHESHQKEAAKKQEMQEFGNHQSFFSSTSNGHVAQYFSTPTAASSMQKFINEQAHPHMHPSLNSMTSTRMVSALQPAMLIQPNSMGDGRGQTSDQTSGFSFEQKTQIPFEQFSPMSGDGIEPQETIPSVTSMAQFLDSPKSKQQETPGTLELKQHTMPAVSELKELETSAILEQKEQKAPAVLEVLHKKIDSSAEGEKKKENVPKENGDGRAKVENGGGNKDDKDMRLFKNALVESVKEILKPTWKLGRMSREVHKTVVKKVVDKVTGTIQADHIPKTQDKIDQYLSHAKTKISKLVQAYVDRHHKTDS